MREKALAFQCQRALGVLVVPGNGYWGYETVENKVLCDFNHRRLQPLRPVTNEITGDGLFEREVAHQVRSEVMREVISSVERSPQVAYALGTYPIEVAKRMGVETAEGGPVQAAFSEPFQVILTDLHIKEREPQKSIAYPGPRLVTEDEMPMINALLAKLEGIDRDDFMVEFEDTFWRGRHDKRAVDGAWFRLRRMADVAPDLGHLPSPMPAAIKSILMSGQIGRGGLIHIAGGPGCGKTTTGSATVVSRLTAYGGVAYCVEDPPELPLNGWHGKGYCTQTWVAGDNAADWMESMRGVLRSQPTGTNLMMYVGEVRDADTARAMLRAASNGFLVISTGFGSDIVSGIDTFFQLVGRDHAASLAAVLRVILHQNIEDERFQVQVLTSESASSPVGNIIRSGQLAQLQNEITFQRNQLMSGRGLSSA